MRVIKSDSGFLAYQKIFRHVQTNNSVMVVWQVTPGTGERTISETRLNSFHLESGLIHLELPDGGIITSDLPIYCYSEDGQFIFKTEIQNIKDSVFSIGFPPEIKMLEEPDVTVISSKIGKDLSTTWRTKRIPIEEKQEKNYMVVKSMRERSSRDQEFLTNQFTPTLDEEDKMYADKRETPRARPKIDKFVKIKSEQSEEVHLLKLFDLSQGGIGFITMEAHLFPKGSTIRVVGFEEFNLDDALVGKVMSHRPVDDTEIEFKIGCKFADGQD